jgi:hypothetical protein
MFQDSFGPVSFAPPNFVESIFIVLIFALLFVFGVYACAGIGLIWEKFRKRKRNKRYFAKRVVILRRAV